jgi:purine-nucleoside phosphorylase
MPPEERDPGPAARAADLLRRRLGEHEPRVAIVLGSGLGAVADAVAAPIRVPYGELPGFPAPGAPGHQGEFVAGTLAGVPVLVQSGRFHLYEGHAPATVALPVRVFARLGIGTLILTNAAGAIRPTLRPPTLMLIADHVNLMFRNPLVGPVEEGEERFPDMSEPYDRALRALAREAARAQRIPLEEGVYAALLGPSFETPAEIRMLARLGADAVGMSTVPEVLAARARGMRCLGVSSVTNWAAGLAAAPLSHEEVLHAGAALAADLGTVIQGVVARLEVTRAPRSGAGAAQGRSG